MQSEFFDCSICTNHYNSTDRLPKILPGCGHTICSSCLKQILQSQHVNCPLDRKPLDKGLKTVEMIPTNILILQMLDGKSQPQYQSPNCPIHKEPKSFYCIEDKIEICKKCANEKSHHGHNVQSSSDILSKAAIKKNKLQGLLGDFEGEVTTIQTLLEEDRKDILLLMKNKFAKLRDILSKKEQEISSEIDLFFMREKSRIENQIRQNLSLREVIRTKISNLSQLEINDKLLKELEDNTPISQFSSANQYEVIYSHSKKMHQNIENAFENLICLAGSVIQEFQPLPPESSLSQMNQKVFDGNTREKNFRLEVEYGWLHICPLRAEDNLDQVQKNNMEIIAKSKDLTKICFDFRKQNLCKKIMASIAQLWKEFPNITSVRFLLTNPEFTNEDFLEVCSYSFSCSRQIQSLSLYCASTKINETGVKKFSQVIDGRNIKNFSLDLSECPVTDSGLKELARNLVGNLKNIESFELRLSYTNITNSSVKELYKELKKVMPALKILDLRLDHINITEESFEYLNEVVLPLGKNLTRFSLRCPRQASSFIKTLLESTLMNLPALTHLDLSYNERELTSETKKCIENFKQNNTKLILDIE